MADSCTVYGQHANFYAVYTAISEICDQVQVCGSEAAWKRIIGTRGETKVTLSSLIQGVPQDKFSRTILGTFSFAYRLSRSDSENHKVLLNRIAATAMIIGIVAEPGLDGFAADCITAVTNALEGFIFNGQDFMDAEGDVLLGAEA